MSHIQNLKKQITVPEIVKAKEKGQKLSMVTCYDASFAKIIDHSNIDMVLVGDSLANVMMGYPNTLAVTLDDMVRYCSSVSRVLTRPFLCADMPFLTYQVSPEDALRNAGRLVSEGGAQAVKLEGGKEVCATVEKITASGIPVMGHLGLTPQSIHKMGGYKVQGKDRDQAEKLLSDAKALENAGVFAVVLEMVPADLADRVTAELKIPTIGIGAGSACDGQVLVLQDLLGFDDQFSPKFLKKYANLAALVREAINSYDQDVKEGSYPAKEHSF